MLEAERLSIDTPEQIALELPIAGIGSRFLALAVDTLLQTLALVVAILLLVLAGPAALGWVFPVSDTWFALGPALLLVFGFCLYWGYFAFFEIIWKGQTPGKRLAGIRVIRDSGRPIDATAAMLRNLLRAVDILPTMYAAGVVCMILNRQSRRLGDYVAGTVVIHDRGFAQSGRRWAATSTPAVVSSPPIRVSDEELVLIETYLDRCVDLDPEVRFQMATRIAQRLIDRTGVQIEARQGIEEYLESLARRARAGARFR